MNFVHTDCKSDIDALLGPIVEGFKDDEIIWVSNDTKLEDIVVEHLKVFSSKSQARKNKWGGDIPSGYKEHKIGKKRFWTLMPWVVTD